MTCAVSSDRHHAAITTSIGTPNSAGQRCAYRAPATNEVGHSVIEGLQDEGVSKLRQIAQRLSAQHSEARQVTSNQDQLAARFAPVQSSS